MTFKLRVSKNNEPAYREYTTKTAVSVLSTPWWGRRKITALRPVSILGA